MKISNKVRDIDTKSCTYYFCSDIINIKIFDPNIFKIDEKSYKNVLFYYIGYATIKDSIYGKINRINLLHLIFSNANGYFEEIDEKKYLTLIPTNDSKEKIKCS